MFPQVNTRKFVPLILFALVFMFSRPASAQNADWTKMSANKNVNFYQVQQDFNRYWQGKTIERGKGYKPFKRWEAYMEPRVYPSGNLALPSQTYTNFAAWQQANAGQYNSAAVSNWTELGPIGSPSGPSPYSRTGAGRVNFVRFDPNNSNTMYVGAPDGGLWKSTNGGTSWSTNTDFLTIIGCADLAIDPTNTNIMYLATGDLEGDRTSIGVLKSTDGGTTWNTTGLSWSPSANWKITKLLMDPIDPSIMIAASNVAIWRTTDGWATSGFSLLGEFKDMEFNPGNSNIVYAAGTTFHKSVDNGANWTQITSGLPSTNVQRIALAVTAANASYVYALAGKASDQSFLGVYRSTDNGTTFNTMATTPNILGWATDGLDAGGQAFFDLAIVASPTNAEVVTTGGVNHWQSTNGGVDWTNLSFWAAGEIHADIHELNYLPGSGTTMYSCNDGGIFKSINNGANWTDISSNLAISQMVGIGLSANIATTMIAGEQDNGTNLKTGSSWNNVSGGDGGECFIDYTDNNTIYMQYVQGVYSRSDDGGATAMDIRTGLPGSGWDFYSKWGMDPVNPNKIYTGGTSTIYRTTNKGANWGSLLLTLGSGTVKGFAISPSDTNIIYEIKPANVHRSVSGGFSWTDVTGTLPVGSAALTNIAVSNTDANKAWVTFSGYSDGNKLFMTTDGGGSWTNISTGLPNLPVNAVVYTNGSVKDAIYIGCDIGVYYWDNTLSSCVPFSTNLPNVAVRDLEIFYPTEKLRAATYGRGSWETSLNEPLPVQLASFTGVFVNSAVQLAWRTVSEVNNYGFYVQERSMGAEWSEVANSFIAGHGTTNEPQSYSFTHNIVVIGQRQYRLKQVDLDGAIHFTEPITVSNPTSVTEKVPVQFSLKQNYPNPFNPATNITFSVAETGRATLEIFNPLGQKLVTLFDGIAEAGSYKTIRFDGSSLASGMYFYRLQSGNRSELKKLLLLK